MIGPGVAGKIADTFNEVIGMNQRMARELDRISRVVGKEGANLAAGVDRERLGLLGRIDRVGE